MSSEEKEDTPKTQEAEADPNLLQEVEEEPDEAALDAQEIEGSELAEFDLDSQIEEFRALLEEDPDHPIHHYNLAEALEESGEREEARAEYERALECDTDEDFHAIIHYGVGNLIYLQLLSGIQSVVVKSSVGLHSAHKPGDSIVEVFDEDYTVPV